MLERVVFVGADEDAMRLSAALAEDVELVHLSPDAACEAVERREPALLVFGLGEPWRRQREALARLHIACQRSHVRVLALVPRDDPAGLELAFARGVADCAGWPIDITETGARIRMLLQRRRAAELRRAEAKATQRAAETDALTGLGNRRMLSDRLATALSRAQTRGLPLAVLMLDIDGLKPINDRLGHHAGDLVLCGVAAALAANVRVGDTVARYGGDELAVVMPDADPATAQAVAARLCAAIADIRFGEGARATVSIGVAALRDDDTDPMALLRRADTALYAAKRSGRNQVAAGLAA